MKHARSAEANDESKYTREDRWVCDKRRLIRLIGLSLGVPRTHTTSTRIGVEDKCKTQSKKPRSEIYTRDAYSCNNLTLLTTRLSCSDCPASHSNAEERMQKQCLLDAFLFHDASRKPNSLPQPMQKL